MALAGDVAVVLASWLPRVDSVTPPGGGWNSSTWLVAAAMNGQDALIDWATPLRGPLLYDLASFAVLTRSAGTRAARWFTEVYAEEIPEANPQLVHPGRRLPGDDGGI